MAVYWRVHDVLNRAWRGDFVKVAVLVGGIIAFLLGARRSPIPRVGAAAILVGGRGPSELALVMDVGSVWRIWFASPAMVLAW
jgi:shikimate kinase